MTFGQAWMGWVVAIAIASPHGAQSAKITRISDIQNCLDDMETVPESDDPVPILVSADAGCVVVQALISI
jgi:hypothetical protein